MRLIRLTVIVGCFCFSWSVLAWPRIGGRSYDIGKSQYDLVTIIPRTGTGLGDPLYSSKSSLPARETELPDPPSHRIRARDSAILSYKEHIFSGKVSLPRVRFTRENKRLPAASETYQIEFLKRILNDLDSESFTLPSAGELKRP